MGFRSLFQVLPLFVPRLFPPNFPCFFWFPTALARPPPPPGSALASNGQAVAAAVNSEIAASVSTFLWLLTLGDDTKITTQSGGLKQQMASRGPEIFCCCCWLFIFLIQSLFVRIWFEVALHDFWEISWKEIEHHGL